MAINIVPLDESVEAEVYPGYRPEQSSSPWMNESLSGFRKEDESRFWFLDFHWPRGFSPMGLLFLEDCQLWGTQMGSRNMPLPTGDGITGRLYGTHVYTSMVPVESEWEIESRSARLAKTLPRFLDNFDSIWEGRVEELSAGLRYFEQYDTDKATLEDLRVMLIDARSFHRRAWEIHFEMMYPLLANYLGFHGICGQLEIDPSEISKFLQGYDTKIMECDRELWRLAASARDKGLEDVFAGHDASELNDTLRADPRAASWIEDFDDFLDVYGWRTDGISDINLAPWIEEPISPLGNLKGFLQKGEDHDFVDARRQAVEQREAAIDAARSKLTKGEQRTFDAALASCQKANFAWWNEEHNYYIDLRATIPLRKACLAISEKLGAEQVDDSLYLFWDELMDVLDGRAGWAGSSGLVSERRDYYESWLERRHTLPKVFGTIPESVTDPILLEVFGLHDKYFAALRNADREISEMSGVPASSGVARGTARVLHHASELHSIDPGDVLVCEATTPSWTPAFAKISACVCDGGGTLTHASIVSREYGIPCVVGVGVGTTVVQDGDEVEVDGTTGAVRVFKGGAG